MKTQYYLVNFVFETKKKSTYKTCLQHKTYYNVCIEKVGVY